MLMGVLYNKQILSTPPEVSFTYSTSDYNGFDISCVVFSDGEIIFNSSTGEFHHILIQLMELPLVIPWFTRD